ncbi:MAG TPA: hypothetical protein VHO84_13400 [Syntrophorhabdaceae bacterium]|nr:hypothetical protein [Syntrophorhabdaceae bacterium]
MKTKDINRNIDDNPRNFKLWILVISLAAGFLIYGLFIFALVGEKGNPGWDFGAVEDTPGASVYSTAPQPTGNAGEPERQHISGTPSQVSNPEEARSR